MSPMNIPLSSVKSVGVTEVTEEGEEEKEEKDEAITNLLIAFNPEMTHTWASDPAGLTADELRDFTRLETLMSSLLADASPLSNYAHSPLAGFYRKVVQAFPRAIFTLSHAPQANVQVTLRVLEMLLRVKGEHTEQFSSLIKLQYQPAVVAWLLAAKKEDRELFNRVAHKMLFAKRPDLRDSFDVQGQSGGLIRQMSRKTMMGVLGASARSLFKKTKVSPIGESDWSLTDAPNSAEPRPPSASGPVSGLSLVSSSSYSNNGAETSAPLPARPASKEESRRPVLDVLPATDAAGVADQPSPTSSQPNLKSLTASGGLRSGELGVESIPVTPITPPLHNAQDFPSQ